MRRKNIQIDSEEESDAESSPDNSKKVSPKRKRGRPPGAKNKRPRLLDDSDDEAGTQQNGNQRNSLQNSDNDSGSSSDFTPSPTTNNQKATPKRKRGRPPKAINRQALQSDSDDEPPTQPTVSNIPNNQNNSVQDDDDDNNDSDSRPSTSNKKATSKRKVGRPPKPTNRQTDDNDSPQPSTSHVIDDSEDPDESGSGSESADSDYGPVTEKSFPKRNGNKSRTARNAKQQKLLNGVNSSKVQKRNQLNTSNRKGSKLSHSTSNGISFDEKLVENLAQKLVYFLLIEDQKKYAIKRKAIIANVFKDEEHSPKLYLAVLTKANNAILKKIYGMELMELEHQKDSYMLINRLDHDLGIYNYVDLPPIKQQQQGLILYLLTVIFMNENVITEDELTKCLKPLGMDLTAKKLHPIFGDVKKYITSELVKQMYVNYECISKEPPKYEFTWGPRAKQEFDKRDLLKFVCQIMSDTTPEEWRFQYKDADKSSKPSFLKDNR